MSSQYAGSLVGDKLKKNIEISEVFTIDTDENRCALLFSLQLQHELNDAKMLFLTANNFQLVHDNLERVKPYITYFDTLHARTKYLFLKESWLSLNEQYGARALSNELSSLVEHSQAGLFFLHRIDLFFDKIFDKELEDMLIAFIKDIRYHHKKVIFSYNSKTVTGKAFEELFVDRRDISYRIEEDKSDVDGDCFMTIKTYNKFLKKPYAQIVLISDQEDIVDMHHLIFDNQNNIQFKHRTLEAFKRDVNAIDEMEDVVIFSGTDMTLVPKIKEKAHFAKIFQLSDKKFLRKTDRGNAKKFGIDYLAASNFDVEEYIESIEAVIENDFYSRKLKDFFDIEQSQEVDFDALKRYVIHLKKQQILFSLLSVKVEDIEISSVASLIREHDYIYHDRGSQTVVFVLLNILRANAHDILAKRLGIQKHFITTYHDVTVD